jgi:hypothetical protein
MRIRTLAAISTLLVAFITYPTALAQTTPSGNNSEATDFAATMTKIAKATWPKANIVWRLELTPQQMARNIVQYRKSVEYCKVTIYAGSEWQIQTKADQETYIKSVLNALHKSPALSSGTLDYYPNSSGELTVKIDGRTVATGRYSAASMRINVQPGTYKADSIATASYSATISAIREGGAVRFKAETNLPTSEEVLFTVSQGSYSAQSKARVVNGSAVTEGFTNGGSPLSPGIYTIKLNVFNPRTGLMIAATGEVNLFRSQSVRVVFK